MWHLTERQLEFVRYLVLGSAKTGADAARQAGYSDRNGNARRIAWKLLQNPRVLAEIRRQARRLRDPSWREYWLDFSRETW